MGGVTCTVPPKVAQWVYFISFLVLVVVAWLLRDYGGSALDFSPLNDCLAGSTPPNPDCMGRAAVIAIALGSFCFFSLLMLLTLGVTRRDSWRLPIHTGFWPLKFLLWGGAIAGFMWAPSSALEGFSQAARVFSGVFILVQLLILLEFIYAMNTFLVEGGGAWHVLLVAASALLIAGSLVGVGFLFHFWAPQASCSLNIWFITSMLLFFLIYTGISMSPLRNESAGLFTSACVFAYSIYYCWSALNSEPLSHACASSSSGSNKTIQIIGFILAIVALAFSTMSAGTSSNAFDLSTGGCDDDELPHRPDFFYCVFALASCYTAMLLVGWDLAGGQQEYTMDRGWGSVWVKIIAAWLCCALYTWSLVAHRVLKNRQF